MSDANEAMNRFLRGERGLEEPETGVISDKQEAQIEKYMALGASYQEARDMVLGYTKPDPPPKGDAGTGRGGDPQKKQSMSDWIRKKAGYFRG